MLKRPIIEGARVAYDVPLGLVRDDCGPPLRRLRPGRGEVLSVDARRGKAWILLNGEVHPRSVPADELRTDTGQCARRRS